MAFINLCWLRITVFLIALIFCSNNLFAQALLKNDGIWNGRHYIEDFKLPSSPANDDNFGGSRFAWTKRTVVKAVKNGLKTNLLGILIGVGVSALLEEIEWFVDDDGELKYRPNVGCDADYCYIIISYNVSIGDYTKKSPMFPTARDACEYAKIIFGIDPNSFLDDGINTQAGGPCPFIKRKNPTVSVYNPPSFGRVDNRVRLVTDEMIDAIPDDLIKPEPSDIPLFRPKLGKPDTICRLGVKPKSPKRRRPDLCDDCEDGKNGDDGRDGNDGKPGKTGKTGKEGDDGDDGKRKRGR